MFIDNKQKIKKSKREASVLKEMSKIFLLLQKDIPSLINVYVSRVEIPKERSSFFIFIYSSLGKELVDEVIGKLIFYTPSIKTLLAKNLGLRVVPNIKFLYDGKNEKRLRIESLIDKISVENKGDE